MFRGTIDSRDIPDRRQPVELAVAARRSQQQARDIQNKRASARKVMHVRGKRFQTKNFPDEAVQGNVTLSLFLQYGLEDYTFLSLSYLSRIYNHICFVLVF